jgi:hypothetical protein
MLRIQKGMTFNIDTDKIDRLITHGADLYYENTENGNTPLLEGFYPSVLYFKLD